MRKRILAERLLKDRLGWREMHFANFLEKYYGKRDINQLSKKEASKVIISLKKVLQLY